MKTMPQSILVLAFSLIACATEGGGEDVGMALQAQEASLGAGNHLSIPYPIQNDDFMYPKMDSLTGKPKSAWEGTYAELQIADAYGQCQAEVAGVTDPGPGLSLWEIPSDNQTSAVFNEVVSHMTEHPCPLLNYGRPYGSPIYPVFPVEWALRRSHSACNMDAETGEPRAAFVLPERNPNSLAVKFAAWLGSIGSTYGAPYNTIRSTYTDLCVAQRLQDLLESPSVFAGTSQDHMAILGHGQERAKVAMTKLGFLVRLSMKSGPVPAEYAHYANSLIWWWLNENSSTRNQLRADFLRAAKLTNASTTALGSYLEREAGARRTTASNGDDFERDWGAGSARHRLMRMVFGGDPMADMGGTLPTDSSNYFRRIREHSNDPRLSVLFNLARDANALWIQETPEDMAFDLSVPLDIDPRSWQWLYRDTELNLRMNDCRANGGTTCTRAALTSQLPPLTMEGEFLLKKDFGITLRHAQTLVTMLWDAAVKSEVFDWWANAKGTFHLSGRHRIDTVEISGTPRVALRLDPNTTLMPYSLAEYAAQGQSLCTVGAPNWEDSFLSTCTDFFWDGYFPDNFTLVGALPSLASAREVLVEMAAGNLSDKAQVTETLAGVERLTGDKTVILGERGLHVVQPEDADPLDFYLANQGGRGSARFYNVNLKTGVNDPNGAIVHEAEEVWGPSDVNMSYETSLPANQVVEVAAGRRLGISRLDNLWRVGTNIVGTTSLLRQYIGGRASGKSKYLYLTTEGTGNSSNFVPARTTVAYSGWFVDLVNRITAVQDVDWARPKFDGFGLPTNWVPPADASLIGGNAGEESYAYLLRSAKSAAEEATAAVKTALDQMSEEARDDAALAQAVTRAKGIGGIEEAALCGEVSGCSIPMQTWDFRVSDITSKCATVGTRGIELCKGALQEYNRAMPWLDLPAMVVTALQSTESTFADPKMVGSELQQVLVRIWSAARLVTGAMDQAVNLAVGFGQEEVASNLAVLAANASMAATQSQLTLLSTEFAAGNATVIATENANRTAAAAHVSDADRRAGAYCSTRKMECYRVGQVADPCAHVGTVMTTPDEILNYCGGPMPGKCGLPQGQGDSEVAQATRCTDALIALKDALAEQKRVYESGSTQLLNAFKSSGLNADRERSIRNQWSASQAQYNSVMGQRVAQMAQGAVQVGGHAAVIRQTVGELIAALGSLKQLQLRSNQIQARADLEIDAASATNNTNAELRRKYRSYDMWRARALLDSARRLAVVARRGIEARFTVDLSTLQAEQAFVASPATWADEIYESDLNAPEVVGLTQSQSVGGSVYPNKLIDYVGNLERFVQGYTITHPTSVSLPDTEILTLGGPDQAVSAADDASISLSPDSSGWRFYCPDQNAWVTHPGLAQYPLVTRGSTLCSGGKAPTLAKIGFWLDSWGSRNGAWTRPQYTDRHNVRWRRLAVNLVGTGIRDCTKSNDSMSCYTNPFIRFNMVQAGPSWQTNYAGQWRSLDIPTAFIEGGKALAAEEWLEPVSNSWNMPYVANVARGELFGRPVAGNYELVLELTPDVRLDRIERVQLLAEQDYWVRQSGGQGLYGTP